MFAKLLPYFETKFSLASQDLLELHCLHRTWKPKYTFRSSHTVKEKKKCFLAAHTQAEKLQSHIFNATVNAVSAPPSNLVVQQFIKSSARAETWHPKLQKEKHQGGKARNPLGRCSVAGAKGGGQLRHASGRLTSPARGDLRGSDTATARPQEPRRPPRAWSPQPTSLKARPPRCAPCPAPRLPSPPRGGRTPARAPSC